MRPFFACALSALALTIAASAAPDPKKSGPIDDSAQIAEKLLDRIDIGQRMEKVPFREVLEYLQNKTGLTILTDIRAIRADGDMGAIDDMQITIPTMKNVRIETVIHQVLDQMDLDFVIASDHVRITTHKMKDLITGQARRLPELYPVSAGEDQPEADRKDIVRSAGNVTVSFRDIPAADALKEIASRAGRTVVVSAPAADKAKTAVTLTLSNVPFETAAASLAEAAGLRAFRTANVVVIVTPERAKVAESAVTLVPGFGMGCMGQIGMAPDEMTVLARTLATKNVEADAQRAKLEEQVKKLTADLEALKKK